MLKPTYKYLCVYSIPFIRLKQINKQKTTKYAINTNKNANKNY